MVDFPVQSNKYIKFTRWHVLEYIREEGETSFRDIYSHFNVRPQLIHRKLLSLMSQNYVYPIGTISVSPTRMDDDARFKLGASAHRWLRHKKVNSFLGVHNAHYEKMCDFIEVSSDTYNRKKRVDYV